MICANHLKIFQEVIISDKYLLNFYWTVRKFLDMERLYVYFWMVIYKWSGYQNIYLNCWKKDDYWYTDFYIRCKVFKKGLYRFGVVFTVPWGFSQFLDTQGIHRHWGSYTDKAHCNIHALCHMGDSLLTILILGGPLGAEIVLFSIIP